MAAIFEEAQLAQQTSQKGRSGPEALARHKASKRPLWQGRTQRPADIWPGGGTTMISADGAWAPADVTAAGSEEGRTENQISGKVAGGSWTWPEMGVLEPQGPQSPSFSTRPESKKTRGDTEHQVWVHVPTLYCSVTWGHDPSGWGGEEEGTRPISIPHSQTSAKHLLPEDGGPGRQRTCAGTRGGFPRRFMPGRQRSRSQHGAGQSSPQASDLPWPLGLGASELPGECQKHWICKT